MNADVAIDMLCQGIKDAKAYKTAKCTNEHYMHGYNTYNTIKNPFPHKPSIPTSPLNSRTTTLLRNDHPQPQVCK